MLDLVFKKLARKNTRKLCSVRNSHLSHFDHAEDYHDRQREELCKQFRHQQYFYGYKPCS